MGASQGKAVLEHARLQVRETALASHSQLMAWGRSESFVCGAPVNGMMLRPKQITNLSDVRIAKVFAGNKHSAALLADGSIRTWGRNLSGQLGIGVRSDAESSPTGLQELEPYHKFTHLALGGNHSLFVDDRGSVWAAGSNEWGQLGLGTALSSLSTAYQRPQNFSYADNPENLMPMPVVMVKTEMDHRVSTHRNRMPHAHMTPCSSSQNVMQLQSVGLQSRPTGDRVAGHLAGSTPEVEKERVVDAANEHHTVAPNHHQANTLAAAAAGLSNVGPLLEWNNIAANEAHWPVRIGRDLSPLFEGFADGRRVVTFAEMEFNKNLSAAGLSLNVRNPREFIDLLSAMPLSLEAESQSSSNSSSSSQSSGQHWMLPASARVEGMPDSRHGSLLSNAATHGVQALHEMAVTKVAAGWACSAALTTTGEVWMFGYSYDRLFANGNAVQTEGRPIDGRPARLIAENGGAIDIVIGFQYCAALARNGSVVLWGKVAPEGVVVNWSIGSEAQVRSLTSIQDAMTEGALGRFTGVLPAMTHLAAGKSQLVMSNGEGVWHMRVLPDSWEKTVATIRQMRFNDTFEGVQNIASGGEASAVVDKAGKLWMWGLIAETSDAGLGRLPGPKTSLGQEPAPCVSRHQKNPSVVPDLDPVTDVALGKNHVLAVTSTS